MGLVELFIDEEQEGQFSQGGHGLWVTVSKINFEQ